MSNFHEGLGECNYLAGLGCPACEHGSECLLDDHKSKRGVLVTIDDFEKRYINANSPSRYEAHYIISGLHCGGCVSQCEYTFSALMGIEKINIYFDTKECHITFFPDKITPKEIENTAVSLGFKLSPFTEFRKAKILDQEEKKLLTQMGVAGITMMPVMMASVTLYYGAINGMSDTVADGIAIISFLMATGGFFYSGQSFFSGFIKAIKMRAVTMDVTIGAALIIAYTLSTYNSVYQAGSTYFESLLMLIFIILSSRFLELKIRQENTKNILRETSKKRPLVKRQIQDECYEWVPEDGLQINDMIVIHQGGYIPADGIVQEDCLLDESAFSGESSPVKKMQQESAYHGSYNRGNAFLLLVTATKEYSRLALINQLADDCLKEKPAIVKQADKIASYFLGGVLLLCGIAIIYWYPIDSSVIPQVVLSILVAACPCALSIATPSAVTQAVNNLRKQGVLVNKHDVIEKLRKVQHVIFDKTGTLTALNSGVSRLCTFHGYDQAFVVAVASALEEDIIHPVAAAIQALQLKYNRQQYLSASNVVYEKSGGVEGVINGEHYFLGNEDYIKRKNPDILIPLNKTTFNLYTVFLASKCAIVGQFVFEESTVIGAIESVNYLKRRSLGISIISGDSTIKVNHLASFLGVDDAYGEMSASGKLSIIKSFSKRHLMMIGDGYNDYPAQSKSFLSVALPYSPDLSKVNADIILLNKNLSSVPTLLQTAWNTHKILKQGFIWSIGYNILALSLAFLGMLTPLVAAVGMSISSLLVVGNTLRIK